MLRKVLARAPLPLSLPVASAPEIKAAAAEAAEAASGRGGKGKHKRQGRRGGRVPATVAGAVPVAAAVFTAELYASQVVAATRKSAALAAVRGGAKPSAATAGALAGVQFPLEFSGAAGEVAVVSPTATTAAANGGSGSAAARRRQDHALMVGVGGSAFATVRDLKIAVTGAVRAAQRLSKNVKVSLDAREVALKPQRGRKGTGKHNSSSGGSEVAIDAAAAHARTATCLVLRPPPSSHFAPQSPAELTAVAADVNTRKDGGGAATRVHMMTDVMAPGHRALGHKEVAEKMSLYAVTAAYDYTRLKSGAAAATAAPPSISVSSDALVGKGKGKGKGRKTRAAGSSSPVIISSGHLGQIVIDTPETEAVRAGAIIGCAVNNCRNLGNLRHDEGNPLFYTEWALHNVLRAPADCPVMAANYPQTLPPLPRTLALTSGANANNNANKKVKAPGVRLCSLLQGEEVERRGLRLLYNVGKGAMSPSLSTAASSGGKRRGSSRGGGGGCADPRAPQVLVMEYIGAPQRGSSVALVGKGVTFDSGGLNVKPFGSMETMHTDMMGAAVALTTMQAAAALNLPLNLTCAVGLVENSIGPASYHPSSIITPYQAGGGGSGSGGNSKGGESLRGGGPRGPSTSNNGGGRLNTVEILNTDAEGRLVLADLLAFVRDREASRVSTEPKIIIDLATLTGAIIVALGERRAGLFSNSGVLSAALQSAGRRSGEEVWPMPVGEEHVNTMRGGGAGGKPMLSDLINTGGRAAGSCTAAAFLQQFVPPPAPFAYQPAGVSSAAAAGGGKGSLLLSSSSVRGGGGVGHRSPSLHAETLWAHLDIAGVSDNGNTRRPDGPAGVTGFGVQLLIDFLRSHCL